MVARSTIGVLALQGDVREHQQVLERLGAKVVKVKRPRDLANIDGIVLPGGESTTMDQLLRIFELREPVESALAGGLPAYGTCAGMILLASEVLDGRPDQRGLAALDVTVRRNAFGRQVDSFEAHIEVAGLDGGPFPAVFIRAPWVEKTGPKVKVLATCQPPSTSTDALDGGAGKHGPVAVAVRQGAVLATAFHPEMTADPRVHELFLQMVRETSG